jgi:hypothetical protein
MDAYEEIFAWLMTHNDAENSASFGGHSDYKYVPVAKFKSFMQDKLCAQADEFEKVYR